jgi:hypothetical protein
MELADYVFFVVIVQRNAILGWRTCRNVAGPTDIAYRDEGRSHWGRLFTDGRPSSAATKYVSDTVAEGVD